MIDFLKTYRRFIILLCVGLGFAPFTPEPHLFGKIRWVFGGATGMQPMDWFDLLQHSFPFVLLSLSFIPTQKSKNMETILKSGACTIIDVRTPGEYLGGHVADSKNIPLSEIAARIVEISALPQPIVLCCASGLRSAQATSLLKKAGLECCNAGTWTKLNNLKS